MLRLIRGRAGAAKKRTKKRAARAKFVVLLRPRPSRADRNQDIFETAYFKNNLSPSPSTLKIASSFLSFFSSVFGLFYFVCFFHK